MHETRNWLQIARRLGHLGRYLQGTGMQLLPDDDRLDEVAGLVHLRDRECGDLQYLAEIEDGSYDFLYGADALEHTYSVRTAIENWIRVIRPGGYLYLLLPDYLLYEKLCWPSPHNADHKYSFSTVITREQVNRENHYHIELDLRPLLMEMGASLIECRLADEHFDYNCGLKDQTVEGALAHIVIVARRVPDSKVQP